MKTVALISLIFLGLDPVEAPSAERTIGVFVALADIRHQGIGYVSKRAGRGDDPENNIYWGAADALVEVFRRDAQWKLVETSGAAADSIVLRTRVYRRSAGNARLTARAYNGAFIRRCIEDFETAVHNGTFDLVVFIGHNGLMDFDLPSPTLIPGLEKKPDCVVLCCKSEQYFKTRLQQAGGHPIVLTTQNMYPGAFLLRAIAGAWIERQPLDVLRERAGSAYAANQHISRRAGVGIFSRLPN